MKTKEEKAVKYIMFIGFFLLILFFVLVYYQTPRTNQNTEPQAQISQQQLLQKVLTQAPFLGDENAPTIVMEFGDFQCTYCKEYVPVIQELTQKHGDRIKLYWIHATNQSAHPQALSAATAAQCANEQDKFWEFHDILFDQQSNLSQSLYLQIAESLNLDLQKFSACLADPETTELIQTNLQLTQRSDITSTPALLINNSILEGVFTLEEIEDALGVN